MMRAGGLLTRAAEWFFPQARCLGCDEPRELDTGSALCAACAMELEGLRIGENACPHCLSPIKSGQACAYCAKGGMAGIERAFAPYVYRDIARKLIVPLKFGPVELAAAPLAREMALQVSGIRFDALVPMPLHSSHFKERGMNQSLVLCGLITEQTGLMVLDALKKTRKTKRQSTLPAAERESNVKGAIALKAPVNGMNLLLVDDVRTTGATAREAAKILREGGAASVCLLTAAVATAGGAHHE